MLKKEIKRIAKSIVYALPSTAVLMFHHVTDTPKFTKSGCILSSENFYDVINYFNNYTSVKDSLRFSFKKRVALTFDDGLSDVFHIAYPFLKKKQIPFTVFVVTDFLDTDGYITTEELKILAADPLVTIGSHGMSHKVFPQMTAEEKKKELIISKEKLEIVIGKEVEFFAYSHGQYDEETLSLVKVYKYAFGVTAVPLLHIMKTVKRYTLPRYNISNDSCEYFKKKLFRYSK